MKTSVHADSKVIGEASGVVVAVVAKDKVLKGYEAAEAAFRRVLAASTDAEKAEGFVEETASVAGDECRIVERTRSAAPSVLTPNQPPEPTPPLVTPAAGAPVAPSGVVAHL